MNVLLNSLTHHVPFFAKERMMHVQDKRITLVALAIIVLAICYACYRSCMHRKKIVPIDGKVNIPPKDRIIVPVKEPEEFEPEPIAKEPKRIDEETVQNNFVMKILNIQDFPIQSLPVELQAMIFSAFNDPFRIERVCHDWKDIAETHTYFYILNEIEQFIGEKRAQAIYVCKNLRNPSSKEKLRCLFQDQKNRLNYILFSEPELVEACLKQLGSRKLDLASFQKCEQWIKDYNLLVMCRLASEHDLPYSKIDEAISNVLEPHNKPHNFKIAEIADNLRKNYLHAPLQNTKRLDFLRIWREKRGEFGRPMVCILRFSEILSEIGQFTQLEWIDACRKWIYDEGGYPELETLSILPPEIGRLAKLKHLALDINRIASLPSEIGQLTELQHLHLHQLTILPAEIGKLTQLRHLSISGRGNNQLTALPTEIWQLINLKHLSLNNNQLTALPAEIGKLINLKNLELVFNKFSSLPSEIGQLAALKKCNLSYNKLTALPPEICQLTALHDLSLGKNQLTILPAEIWQLTALHNLSLANNQLTILPPEIGKLTQLYHLYLSNNEISSLPSEIGQLAELSSCYLDNNKIKRLPIEMLQLIKLRELTVHGNPLNEPLPLELQPLTFRSQ